MANEPNTPDHRWYERRNNIALSNEDLSRETIFDSGIQKINSWINSQPWGFDYPQLVLDFDDEYFRVDGGDTTFANAITHTRASTATYVDSTGTLQTAAINEPRLGHHVYNGTAYVNEGLLHESEARTNLLLRSEEFDNAHWTKGASISVTADAIASPDGTTNADLAEQTGGTFQSVSRIETVVSGSTYTFSVFLKANTATSARLRVISGSTDANLLEINLANGTSGSYQAEDYSNGWFRYALTFVADGTTANVLIYPANSTAALGSSYIWGAQLEAAPTPSSYIPTAGTTVTRSADVLTIPAANLPYNLTALSIQMDGAINFADEGLAAQQTFLRWQLDTNNLISVDLDTDSTATGEINFNQASGGVFDTVVTSGTALAPSIATAFNIASRHGSTFINGALNGTALTADTTPVALANLSASNLSLGFDYMGTIKTLRLWGQDVGNAGISEASS